MPSSSSAQNAARKLIERNLGLRARQNLLIFADQDSLNIAQLVTDAGHEIGLSVTTFFVPHIVQAAFESDTELPLPMEAAIRETDAILSCLSGRAEHTAFRAKVLRVSLRRHTKTAHAPGLTLDILRLLDTNYDVLQQRCRLLALCLVLGRKMKIVTVDGQGRRYTLKANLAGWEQPPGISDGIVRDGAWSNVPSGETYIVPHDVQGQMVVNGSVPGWVIELGEEIILSFEQNRLQRFDPADSPLARHLHSTQIAHAEMQMDENWRNVAEIGIGVNSAIHSLTGVELVDEKMAGTLHIALGSSVMLGGTVESSIHCDLVTLHPTISVDDKLIMEDGKWCMREEDWLPDHRQVDVTVDWWRNIAAIQRSGSRVGDEHGRLVRHWSAGPGRHSSMTVGAGQTAQLCARLLSLLPDRAGSISRKNLIAQAVDAGLDSGDLPGLLWVLCQYDLVHLQKEFE